MKKLKVSPKFEFERKILFEVLPRPFSILKAGIWFSIKANTQITFKTSYDQENAGEKASSMDFVKKILKV